MPLHLFGLGVVFYYFLDFYNCFCYLFYRVDVFFLEYFLICDLVGYLVRYCFAFPYHMFLGFQAIWVFAESTGHVLVLV